MTASGPILVVGGGLIGASWAALFLAKGHCVSVTDPDPAAEARVKQFVGAFWPSLETLGLKEGAAPDNLTFSTDVEEAARGAIFVQENGPENIDLKHKIVAQIERSVSADTIIASSSSGLLVSEIQAKAEFPGRIVLGHPLNPPHLIPVVEIVGGDKTTPETVQKACAFYRSLDKKPIVLNAETKGHIVNRLQVAVWQEAFSLVERGVVSVADIDAAVSYGIGLRWALMGPFLTMHSSGGAGGIAQTLKHLGAAQRDWAGDLGKYPATDSYIEKVAAGVSDELEGYDFAEALKQRDRVLIDLLLLKAGADKIP